MIYRILGTGARALKHEDAQPLYTALDDGAHLCLAAPVGASTGTRDCMRRARAAGIEVLEVFG